MTKKEYMARFAERDKDWLVEQLAATMVKLNNLRDKLTDYERMERRKEAAENNQRLLRKENANLAEVLTQHGIFPKLLEVSYLKHDCHNCPNADFSNCMCEGEDPVCGAEDNWYGEDCVDKVVVETISFYSYRVDGDNLTGITSAFEDGDYDLVKLRDMRTGETIFEAEADDDDI